MQMEKSLRASNSNIKMERSMRIESGVAYRVMSLQILRARETFKTKRFRQVIKLHLPAKLTFSTGASFNWTFGLGGISLNHATYSIEGINSLILQMRLCNLVLGKKNSCNWEGDTLKMWFSGCIKSNPIW